jgi:hypothetical protein
MELEHSYGEQTRIDSSRFINCGTEDKILRSKKQWQKDRLIKNKYYEL